MKSSAVSVRLLKIIIQILLKILENIHVNAILIVGHSDNEKVYHQHHVPCKIETTLYARRERYGSGDVTLLTNPGSICFR